MNIKSVATLAAISLLSLGTIVGCAKTDQTQPTDDGAAVEETTPEVSPETPVEGEEAPDAAQ